MPEETINQQAAELNPYDMELKRQLHPLADEKNRVELRHGKPRLLCGGIRKDKFCRSYAGAGTDHPGHGRCKFCGGKSTGPKTPEGKAKVAENMEKARQARSARKPGFYSNVLSYEEREAYEEQLEQESISLQHEIFVLKAKILVYLGDWKKKYEQHYAKKLKEKFVRYRCTNPDCGYEHVRGELETGGRPGYCIRCSAKKPEIVETWYAERSPEDAQKYAELMTRVFYSESENGGRSFYTAGTIEDKTLDRALNTLSRLIEKHARLKADTGDDLLSQINKELQMASNGRVSMSWGGKPQTKGGPDSGGDV